ncbi:MAG TPA: NAD(P)-dependent oxidoreductase [Pyrinomonadaceae bacterium]|nr:NAD(P)-dependent oxidoreductase [Pyrinomonadaceae bacterium]
MFRKILVTGSAGHLGEALVRTLHSTNCKVTGIDITPSAFTSKIGSTANRDFVREAMKDVDAVIHSATLHKPHVATHTNQDFIETNITGTLNLLEESVANGVKSFVFTSTTSTFGDALIPPKNAPAVWITEQITPIPKNIYGVTKTAAEDLCRLFYRNHQLNCLILRTSRFFLEDDDQKEVRQEFDNDNQKANEFLFRRVDIEDAVSAHLLALEKAGEIGFGRYIISATTPFTEADREKLNFDAPSVIKEKFPHYEEIYAERGWKMFPKIGRVYVNELARKELGWSPRYDFGYVLDCLKSGKDFLSPLARAVGSKGYHTQEFEGEPYPVQFQNFI